MGTLCLIGLVLAMVAVADAWRRVLAGVVVVVEIRQGDGHNWRWFGLDATGETRCSCFPRRYITEAMARDDARHVLPGIRQRLER